MWPPTATLMLLAAVVPLSGALKKLKEQDIIQRMLKDYDWRVRPRGLNASWPGWKRKRGTF